MKYILAALFVTWTSCAMGTEDSVDCSAPSNTPTIDICLQKDLDLSDQKLNKTYKELLANLEHAEQDWLGKKGALVEPIKKSQRAWVTFRNANCGYYYEQINGTGAAATDLICRKKMTEERDAELHEMFMGSP